MISFWERESFISYDYVIVGGGIVGFSTALHLKLKHPKASVLVLEAGFLPSGASTKNAGFACIGSLSELASDLKTHSESEVLALLKLRHEGLTLLRETLGDEKIQYRASGSHELIFAHETELLNEIPKINNLLANYFDDEVFSLADKSLSDFGFAKEVKHLIYNNKEGSIHTGEMMKHLILKAQSLGVEYKTNSKVCRFEDDGKQVRISIEGESTQLEAKKCIICTNAFGKDLIPDLDLAPGRGQVLLTQPIANLKLKGIFHYNEGYYYFREIAGRILFGGGRNLAFEEECTTNFSLNEEIQAHLEEQLRTVICQGQDLEIDLRWTGIMAFGKTKQPLVKQLSENVWIGLRLGGMGVAIGSKLGQQMAGRVG